MAFKSSLKAPQTLVLYGLEKMNAEKGFVSRLANHAPGMRTQTHRNNGKYGELVSSVSFAKMKAVLEYGRVKSQNEIVSRFWLREDFQTLKPTQAGRSRKHHRIAAFITAWGIPFHEF